MQDARPLVQEKKIVVYKNNTSRAFHISLNTKHCLFPPAVVHKKIYFPEGARNQFGGAR
jgi:hypothetical protein